MPAPAPTLSAVSHPPAAASPFELRHALWADLHARFGPARSYPYAWRLPELARDQGVQARFRAALALAETLYEMGRFSDALENVPDGETGLATGLVAESLDLRARCLWLRDETSAALNLAESAWRVHPDALAGLGIRARFLFLADAPESALPLCRAYREEAEATGSVVDLAWSALLNHWARCRIGEASDPASAHATLARLRVLVPAASARGEALFAEAEFHQSKAASLVWLDHALDQVESFAQHHLKARLLALKAQALDASGLLGEAARFKKLARETAIRQSAWRYARAMAG